MPLVNYPVQRKKLQGKEIAKRVYIRCFRLSKGILKPNKRTLSQRIDNNVLLPPGSYEETEIRINTIYAVELIKKHFKKQLDIDVQSHEINELLWILGQEKDLKDKPYHKVRTIKY